MAGPFRREEILDNAAYERVRLERRRAIIALKRPRRVAVGPIVTLVFENRDTALFQIQEILLAERVTREEEIRHEIEVYSILVPGPGELCATMFIEIPDREERMRRLPELAGIERTVSMELGDARVPARFHDWRDTAERASPVSYAVFPLGDAAAALRDPAVPIRLLVEHPRYRAEALLSEETRASLAGDLHAARQN
jgi:hypothetical protein